MSYYFSTCLLISQLAFFDCQSLIAACFIYLFVLGPLAGGVDEETFIRAFEDVPKISIYSAKEMEEHLISMRTIIQDPSNDWAKRAETVCGKTRKNLTKIYLNNFLINSNCNPS